MMPRREPYGTFPFINGPISSSSPGVQYAIATPTVVVQEDPEAARRRVAADNDRLFLASLTPEEREQGMKRRYQCGIIAFGVFIVFAVIVFILFNQHRSSF